MLEFTDSVLSNSCKLKDAISLFERKCLSRGVPLHGYFLLEGKNKLSEKYFYPYDKDSLHRMYSVTKSLTSLAIGCLEKDGFIRLSDKIYTYFTDTYDTNSLHPYFSELTIENMLTMQTCFYKTTYNEDKDYDWSESYFTKRPDHKCNTVFSYDTSSSQVLAKLVEKITKKTLLDYLREKAFNSIGLSKEAFILTDPSGVSQGGTGLNCTLEDLARIAYLVNNMGVIDGVELLPSSYVKEAVSLKVPTDINTNIDEACGYGYMFWRLREDGFSMYGMGGQLALCFPSMNLVFCTMADTIGMGPGLQIIYDSFYDTIYQYFADNKDIKNPSYFYPSVSEYKSTPCKDYFYFATDSGLNFSNVIFSWDRQVLILEDKNNVTYSFNFSLHNKKYYYCDGLKRKICVDSFVKMNHLFIKAYITDSEQGHIYMDVFLEGDFITIRMENTSAAFLRDFKGCFTAKMI